MRNVDTLANHMITGKYYNFLIFNATSQKAHPARKKPYVSRCFCSCRTCDRLHGNGKRDCRFHKTCLDYMPMSTRVIIPGEDEGAQHAGGIHKRGGVRKGGLCEVYPEMACPWVTLYIQLEKIGQVEWMKQV